MTEIQQLQNSIAEFSDKTFGTNRGPMPALHHLRQEANEVIAEPYEEEEYADCLILLLDAFRNAGGSADLLIETAFEKLAKNKTRKWGKPDGNGVVSHINESKGKACLV